MLDGRCFAGVILLGVQLDGLAGGVGGDFIGTGTHGVGSQVGRAHVVVLGLVHDLRIHDGGAVHRQCIEERRKWFGQLEDDGLVIGSFDGFYHLEIVRGSFLHFLYTFNGELHRLGIHRRAVGKLMTLIQGKGPGEAVIADSPGFGQGRLHFRSSLAVHYLVFHKPFISGISNLPALVIHGDCRVQGFRIHRHANHNGVLRYRTAGSASRLSAAAAGKTKNRQSQQGTGEYSFQKSFHNLSPLRKHRSAHRVCFHKNFYALPRHGTP